MKVINKIFFCLSSALMTFLAVSCVEEIGAELGAPDNKDCAGIYFPSQEGTGDLQIGPDDAKTLKFKVRRTNTRGSLTVPVTIDTNHPGVFSASEIHFEEDAPTAELEVFFPTVKQGVKYECTIKVEGAEYVSSYSQNATHLSFTVTCVKWNKLIGDNGETTGLWRDGVLAEWFSLANPNLEKSVEIYEREDMPGYYRIYDVYNSTYMTNLFGMDASSVCLEKHYTYIDATNPEKVWIPTFKTGVVISADYGELSIGSYVAENEDFGASISSIYGTMENGVITFPANSLQMNLAVLGWYTANSYGLHRIILPGYRALDTDISLEVGITGADGKLPVTVNFGLDIAKVKLYTSEGSLAESVAASLAEDIAAGTVTTDIPDMINSGDISLTFDKTGEYTVIAVGLDKDGKLANYASQSFGYKADPDENKVVLNCGLICSNKYYPDGMTEENSLEIYINGENIKRLHAAIYETEKFEFNREQYLDALDDSQMTEEYLALVNGSGLSLVQGGLVPGTDYTLVVKAYNGYSEETFFVSRSTGGVWDYRLASYTTDDIDAEKMINVLSPSDYYGTYNYYAIEGGSSRYCLGDVTISESNSSYSGQPCVKITGLFPYMRKLYDVKDDSMDFYYYGGYIWNYQLRTSYFIFEGMYVYINAMLYASNGSAYGGSGGIIGTFVNKNKPGSKPCIAFMDSGAAANSNLDITFEGLAILGYEDSSNTIMMGLLDLVESMVLVPKSDDPDPIYPPAEPDEEEMEKASMRILNDLASRPSMNLVESDEGRMMNLIDNLNSRSGIVNYLDFGSAKIIG